MIWEGKSAAEKLDNFPSYKKSEDEDPLESTFIPRFVNTGSQRVLLSFQLNDQNPFTIKCVRADNDRILVVVLYLIRHQEWKPTL